MKGIGRLLAFLLFCPLALTLLGGLLYIRSEGGFNDYYSYFGFPLWWVMDHLEAYRGVNIRSFNAVNLIADVAFFFLTSTVFWFVTARLRGRWKVSATAKLTPA